MSMLTLGSRNVLTRGFAGDRRSVVARIREGDKEIVELVPGELLLAAEGVAIAPGQPVLMLDST